MRLNLSSPNYPGFIFFFFEIKMIFAAYPAIQYIKIILWFHFIVKNVWFLRNQADDVVDIKRNKKRRRGKGRESNPTKRRIKINKNNRRNKKTLITSMPISSIIILCITIWNSSLCTCVFVCVVCGFFFVRNLWFSPWYFWTDNDSFKVQIRSSKHVNKPNSKRGFQKRGKCNLPRSSCREEQAFS
jgi:hypothetical protein